MMQLKTIVSVVVWALGKLVSFLLLVVVGAFSTSLLFALILLCPGYYLVENKTNVPIKKVAFFTEEFKIRVHSINPGSSRRLWVSPIDGTYPIISFHMKDGRVVTISCGYHSHMGEFFIRVPYPTLRLTQKKGKFVVSKIRYGEPMRICD
tara:strand:+ start:240 stop:689 length:450 start_codon:yes stop_codon:yes gene_type:complete